jgi:hypothetical protein
MQQPVTFSNQPGTLKMKHYAIQVLQQFGPDIPILLVMLSRPEKASTSQLIEINHSSIPKEVV